MSASREDDMPKYLIEVRYNAEGVKGVKREGGTSRRANAVKLIESHGGKVEAFYYAYGDVDVFCIFDMPDEAHALAMSMSMNQSDALSARLTMLIAPETIDAAAKVDVAFRSPGR
jgi:uncharacterized protein with GYD domain